MILALSLDLIVTIDLEASMICEITYKNDRISFKLLLPVAFMYTSIYNDTRIYLLSRVYNRKEGEYPTHYNSTVYHPFTGVSDLSSIIHNLWYPTTPLTTTWLYTKQLQVQLD